MVRDALCLKRQSCKKDIHEKNSYIKQHLKNALEVYHHAEVHSEEISLLVGISEGCMENMMWGVFDRRA